MTAVGVETDDVERYAKAIENMYFSYNVKGFPVSLAAMLRALLAERSQLQAQVEAMKTALDTYGTHKPTCPAWQGNFYCKCGLDEAMKP